MYKNTVCTYKILFNKSYTQKTFHSIFIVFFMKYLHTQQELLHKERPVGKSGSIMQFAELHWPLWQVQSEHLSSHNDLQLIN